MRSGLILAVAATLTTSSAVRAAPPPSPPSQTVRVTEAMVASAAATESPAVRASRHDTAAAHAEYVSASRARLPDVTLTARYTRLSSMPARFRTIAIGEGTDGIVLPQLLDGYTTRAQLTVPLTEAWLGLAAAADAAGEVATARRLELAATRARAAFEGRSAYLILQRAWGARAIAEAALEIASQQAADQAVRVATGTAAPTSTLTFDAAKNVASSRLSTAEAEVTAAESRVRIFLPAQLLAARLEPTLLEARLAGVDRMRSSPQILTAEAAARAGDARFRAETLALLPRLALTTGAELTSPSPRAFAVSRPVAIPTWDVTLQLDWNLSALTVGTARRARAAAEVAALNARVEQVRRELEAEHRAAAGARRAAAERTSIAESSLATADKLVAARRHELTAGTATPLDVTSAEAERVRAELEKNDAELEFRLAEARLDFVAGWTPPLSSQEPQP